jgi:Transglutaminase-like superfamily
MAHKFSLAGSVSVTRAGQNIIFLDTSADRYFGLNAVQSAWYEQLGALTPLEIADGNAAKLANRLMNMKLIEAQGDGRSLATMTRHNPRLVSAFQGSRGEGAAAGLAFFLRLPVIVAACWRRHKFSSFSNTLAAARRWKEACGANVDLPRALRLSLAFEAAAPIFFSTRDACRFRSLILLRVLADHGIQTDWVFGVRTSPFSAHCWLECGDLLLNDHTENVRQFSPILRI